MSFLRNLSFAKSETENSSANNSEESAAFGTGLFTGTSKLFDSVNATTSSITSGISTKFVQLKRMASQEAFPETEKSNEDPLINNEKRTSQNSISSEGRKSSAGLDNKAQENANFGKPRLESSKFVPEKASTGHPPPSRPDQPPLRRRSSSEQGGGSSKPRPPKPPPPKMVSRQDTNPLEKNTHRGPAVNSISTLQKHMSVDSAAKRDSSKDNSCIADLSNLTKLECQRIVSEMGNLVSFDESDDKMLQDRAFVQTFIQHILKGLNLTQEEKAKFGELCQSHACRSWFAKCMDKQNLRDKAISEAVFYKLVQYFAVVLFECNVARDYNPAKDLMHCSFYINAEIIQCGTNQKSCIYLYNFLKDQPIWQSLEYWESALLSGIQEERVNLLRKGQSKREAIPFNQLSLYVKHMKSFSLSKHLCHDFVMKQSRLLTISEEERNILKSQIDSIE